MMLTGEQTFKLRDGLQRGFLDAMRLQMFLREQLDKRWNDYASANDALPAAIFRVIEAAEAEGWLEDLVAAASRARPKQTPLVQIAAQLGITPLGANLTNERLLAGRPPISPAVELESLLKSRRRFIDVDVFGAALSEQQARICRIELGGAGTGTGFLIGADLVLTNAHVMKSVAGNLIRAQDVILRFDYLKTASSKEVNKGVVARLHPGGWLVDDSPWSSADGAPQGVPANDELDYCVLRLSEKIGAGCLGGPSDTAAPRRGWITLDPKISSGVHGEYVLILQHPEGDVLKLAIGDHLGFNAVGNRMHYDANTLSGSSGSPIFNADLQLIGLHHSGATKEVLASGAHANQGIPISSIVALLANRGKWPLA